MKRKHLIQFFITIIGLVFINFITQEYFFRLDLTEDGRYSISPATKRMLRNLDDEVFIKVYLEGDFPAGFKRLQKSIQETLEEFKMYAGKNIKYKFIDPSQASTEKEKQKLYQELVEKGITPTNVFAKEGDKKVEKIIFPGAIIQYKNTEVSVLLFKAMNQQMAGALSPEQILNQSIENVEYNLISAIRALTVKPEDKKNIGFLEGNGELSNIELADILETLSETHNVFKLDLPKEPDIKGLDAIVIAKPDTSFSEADKYKIDQYIMRGGKALFYIDAVGIYEDSILSNRGSFSFPYPLELTDMFFKYGVRFNGELIKDLNCGFIPMVVGNMGNQSQITPIPWQYYPLINTFNKKHPIVRNLDVIYTKYIGTLDTVRANSIRKTPLLYTSQYTQTVTTPAFVTFNEARKQPDPRLYNQGKKPIAYLLEGEFTSLYKSRITSSDPRSKNFKDKSIPTKIIVCADGDIIKNDIDARSGNPLPLGYDRYSRRTFSNKDFIINSVEYLLDEEGIISARKKEVVLRPLDKIKVKDERVSWQIFNMLTPLLVIVVFAVAFYFIRKRRFA